MHGGASPTSSVLATVKVMSKMAVLFDPHCNEMADLQVKFIKNVMLKVSSWDTMCGMGKDAAERLRKDAKLKCLQSCCDHMAACKTSVDAIRKWQEKHEQLMNDAEAATQGDDPVILPHQRLLTLDTEILDSPIRSEKELSVMDCVEMKAAEHNNALGDLKQQLHEVTKGRFAGGPDDWRKNLAADATLSQVLKGAVQALSPIRGDEMAKAIESAKKARATPRGDEQKQRERERGKDTEVDSKQQVCLCAV